ncbi:hypothetical protein [Laspinema olomoucense]|nr:hypothetical protein [Laspinema sp. D3d]
MGSIGGDRLLVWLLYLSNKYRDQYIWKRRFSSREALRSPPTYWA